jgi:hypothetical protein
MQFIMMTTFSKSDFPQDLFNRNRSTRCRYPWYTTEVGGGFYMSYKELGGKTKRPDVPPKLTKLGQRWESAQIQEPDSGYHGIIFKRIA